MPAHRRSASSSGGDDASPVAKKDDAYIKKRKRNNDAVRKARDKTKKEAADREENVKRLRKENQRLEGQIEEGNKNIESLKQLLLSNDRTGERAKEIQAILDQVNQEAAADVKEED